MAYEALFSISPLLLSLVEEIAALRERIFISPVSLSWIPVLQKDSRTRNGHASTAIEGNPLTLEEVCALEEGRAVEPSAPRFQREVTNYFTGLRYVEKHASVKKVRHEHLFELHRLMAGEVMDQGEAGAYRTIGVRVGNHLPPHPDQVSPQMFELLEWWNTKATELSPILSSAILHYRFEDIHPFADGNGRVGRALALWELYRRGFDSHHVAAQFFFCKIV
jgi:Fic family protein